MTMTMTMTNDNAEYSIKIVLIYDVYRMDAPTPNAKTNSGVAGVAVSIISLFANFINYLNASYYEAQFTYKHEQARANIHSIYAAVSATPDITPTREQCVSFYNDIRVLENVTETDDPDYHRYKRILRSYIAELSPSILT
jgi:hypothetical protein